MRCLNIYWGKNEILEDAYDINVKSTIYPRILSLNFQAD